MATIYEGLSHLENVESLLKVKRWGGPTLAFQPVPAKTEKKIRIVSNPPGEQAEGFNFSPPLATKVHRRDTFGHAGIGKSASVALKPKKRLYVSLEDLQDLVKTLNLGSLKQ